MSEYYKLINKEAVPCSCNEWAECFEGTSRRVARSGNDDIYVSTVFLGLDHSFGEGNIQIFETMIFGGEHDQGMWRYATWDEAESGHKKACELVGVDCE